MDEDQTKLFSNSGIGNEVSKIFILMLEIVT